MKSNFYFLKALFLVCSLCVASHNTNAQTITDPNFAAAIRTACPTCIDASNKLLAPATTLKTLYINYKGIVDLKGIEGFTNLQTLDCSNNSLTTLPTLSNSLTYLDCYDNQLTSLPTLPNNLVYLRCYNNKLTSLPTLPNSLTIFSCYNNQLTSLPTLPNSLTDLRCYNNQLTSLPTLPNSLTSLSCSDNQLTSLPTLPNGLTGLGCGNNQLTSLPTLPKNLTSLDYGKNPQISVPTLPDRLQQLICNDNQLTSLPTLPNSLTWLDCSNNQLTSLPTLPNSLKDLFCFNNQLSILPTLPNGLSNLYCRNNQLTTLPTLPNSLKIFSCRFNILTTLPTLPNNLTELYCSNNQINCLPTLPNTLGILRIDKDKVNCLPNSVSSLKVFDADDKPISTPPVCTNPTAALSGSQTINAGQTANLSVTLTGIGPWELVLAGKTYTATASPYTIALTPAATTTYTLTSVKTNCNAGAVSGQAVVTLNGIDFPVVAINAGGKTVVCAGNTLKLSGTASGGAGGYVYQWKKDGVSVGGNVMDLQVSDAGQYVVTATDSKGCAGNSGAVSISKGNPTASVSGTNAFCKGTSTTLTATAQNAPGTLVYQWKQDGNSVGDGKNTLAVSQAGSYSVEITDGNGCKATATAVSVTEKGSDLVATVKPAGPVSVYLPDSVVLYSINRDLQAYRSGL